MKQISFQNAYQPEVSASFDIGEQAQTPDGRKWIYVRAKEALSANTAVVPVAVTAVDTVSSSADANGNIIYITKASAGWTIGQFAESWVYVDDGTGRGQAGKVRANTKDTLILYPEYALATALAVADSDITIQSNFQVELAAISDKIQNAVGIAQVAFTDEYYGWVLYNGTGLVVAGEALTVGGSFVTGDNTEGYVVKGTTAKGEFDEQTLGRCLVANAAADIAALVWVDIA